MLVSYHFRKSQIANRNCIILFEHAVKTIGLNLKIQVLSIDWFGWGICSLDLAQDWIEVVDYLNSILKFEPHSFITFDSR